MKSLKPLKNAKLSKLAALPPPKERITFTPEEVKQAFEELDIDGNKFLGMSDLRRSLDHCKIVNEAIYNNHLTLVEILFFLFCAECSR